MFGNKTLKQGGKGAFAYKVTEEFTELRTVGNNVMTLKFGRGHHVHIFAVGSIKKATPEVADMALISLSRFLYETSGEFAKGGEFSQMVMDKLAEIRKERLTEAEQQPHATEVEDEANLNFVRDAYTKQEGLSRAERRRAEKAIKKQKR